MSDRRWRSRLWRRVSAFPPPPVYTQRDRETRLKAETGPVPSTFTLSHPTLADLVPLEVLQDMALETRRQYIRFLHYSPYEPFFIPASMLSDPPSPSSLEAQRSAAPLLQLPTEILTLVFKHVKIPHFQVCFALTCKTMGRIARQKNVMAPWRGYRDKDGLFRLLERTHYIPESLRLCRACFRFMPRSEEYWAAQMSDPAFDDLDVNWGDIFSWLGDDRQCQHRCPWCAVTGYRLYMNERSYLRDNVFLPHPGLIIICPSLNRRMEKA